METRKAQVIKLPTDKAENCIIQFMKNEMWYQKSLLTQSYLMSEGKSSYHLYFTTDEEIKLGDCILNEDYGIGIVADISEVGKANAHYITTDGYHWHVCGSKKVLATTDKSLTNVAQIPQQFIEEYVKAGGIDEVLLEYETNYINWKHDDKIEALIDTLELKTDQNNCVIIHPIEPKFYTKEEVNRIAFAAFHQGFKDSESEAYCGADVKRNFNKWSSKNI